ATTDGSKRTIPRPRMNTSVFAVPRSTAMSRPPPRDPRSRIWEDPSQTGAKREAARGGLSPRGAGRGCLGRRDVRERLVVADVVRRHRLDLGERVALRRADAHRDPVTHDQLARRDDVRDASLPEHEDRVRVVREGLVEPLPEQRLQRAVVSVGHAEREVAWGRWCLECSDEEPQRTPWVVPEGPTVGNAPGRG